MKELSLPAERQTTEIITNDSFIGVEFPDEEKIIVIQTDTERFIGMGADLITFGKWESDSKKAYAERAIERQRAKVFLFDSGIELLKWLIR